MGKGGGKCASRDQSASSSRTPRLPAKRLEKPAQGSSSVSKPSSSKQKAFESDPGSLVPLISKVCFHLTLSKQNLGCTILALLRPR
jgi:hypothetical protein